MSNLASRPAVLARLHFSRSASASRRIRAAAILTAAVATLGGQLSLAQNYIGANGASWETPGNWNPATVPNSAAAVVTVTNGTTVVLGNSLTRTVGTLTIGVGNGVTNGTSTDLDIATAIINNGLFTNGASGNARLRTNGAGMALSGSGVFQFPAGTLDGGGIVTNSSTLSAATANFGANNTAFANSGTIRANTAAGTLTLDPANTTNTNTGLLLATGGGTLSMTGNAGGGWDNTGGTIRAEASSVVEFTTSNAVTGGTLTTTGNGIIRAAAGASAYMTNLTNTGNLRIGNNADLYGIGTITNNATITFDTTSSTTRFRTNGSNLALNGTGSIDMTAGGTIDGGAVITQALTHTIHGQGNIGANNTAFANAGTITADVSGGTLTLDPANTANFNTGTMRAINGATLSMTGNAGGGWDNTGGTIRAENGSVVEFSLSNGITNGTITTTGTGIIRSVSGSTNFLTNVTSTANLRIATNSDLDLVTGLVNNGSITLDTVASTTRLRTNGSDVSITGTGTINMPTGGTIDGGSRITFGSGQTISGQGNLGANNTAFTNNGIVDANVSGATLTLDPANTASAFVNTNILRATNGAILQLTGNAGGDFTNTGANITASGANSVVELTTSARVIGGTLTGTGGGVTREAAGQTVYLQGVTLSTGTTYTIGSTSYTVLEGSLTNNGTITYVATALNSNQRLRTNGADVNITGTGKIILNNQDGTGDDCVIDGGGRVTLGAGQTVQGSGSLGYNNTNFTNNGIIESSVGGIGLDPANSGATSFINNNIIRANAGGLVQFTGNAGGDFTNNGTISASGTGVIELTTSARIYGGTLTGTSGGTLREAANQTVYLNNVTLSTGSTYSVGSNSYTVLEGSITNNGTITYNASTNSTNQRLRTNGVDVAINGTGTIILNNQSSTGSDTVIDGGARITIGAGQTIRGSGSLGYNNTFFTNNGIVLSDNGAIGIDPANTASGFINNGTLRATTGGNITLTGNAGGGFNGGGQVVIDAASSIDFRDSAGIDFTAPVTGAGTLNVFNSANATVNAVRVGGLNVHDSGILAIRTGNGNAATGKVNTLAVATSAKLDLGDSAMIVDYTGGSSLAAIKVLIAGRWNNGAWNGATGIGSSINTASNGRGIGYIEASSVTLPGGLFYGQSADATSVLLLPTYYGDTNLDKTVNFADLLILSQNYGLAGEWRQGDSNFDGLVNFSDLLALSQNYGKTVTGSFNGDWALAQSLATPEPSLIAMGVASASLMLRRRSRAK